MTQIELVPGNTLPSVNEQTAFVVYILKLIQVLFTQASVLRYGTVYLQKKGWRTVFNESVFTTCGKGSLIMPFREKRDLLLRTWVLCT